MQAIEQGLEYNYYFQGRFTNSIYKTGKNNFVNSRNEVYKIAPIGFVIIGKLLNK